MLAGAAEFQPPALDAKLRKWKTPGSESATGGVKCKLIP
jgi:hypothetical protein